MKKSWSRYHGVISTVNSFKSAKINLSGNLKNHAMKIVSVSHNE